MADNVGFWITVVVAVIGITTFLGSVVVFLMGSKDKGTIKTLQDSNTALLQRVGVLEDDNGDLKHRVQSLENENALLTAQRPSAEAIAMLAEQTLHLDERLDTHDIETKQLIADNTTMLLMAMRGDE